MAKLLLGAAVGAACLVLLVPLLVALVVVSIGAPAVAVELAEEQCNSGMGTPAGGAGDVRLIQANEKATLSSSAFGADLTKLVSSGPDFLTLQETYTRSNTQLRPAGYSSWRRSTTQGTRDTAVLWRTDRWEPVAEGTLLLYHSSLHDASRYATWVTFRPRNGTAGTGGTGRSAGVGVVSVISAPVPQDQTSAAQQHHPRTDVERLNGIVNRLGAQGPVLIGGDVHNPHHHRTARHGSRQPSYSTSQVLKATRVISTDQQLGKPPHRRTTGGRAGDIEDIFFQTDHGLVPVSHDSLKTNSDHRALSVDFAVPGSSGPGTGAASSPTAHPRAGVQEGGLGFRLPAPGSPRRASLHNRAAPIPAAIKADYLKAARRYKVPWTLLAGIGMEETNHGRAAGGSAATSSAGARGLMQFMGSTWAAYGVDGDGDGRAVITDDADSAMSAANYLTASGVAQGPGGVTRALFAYNHAEWYVNDVLYYAHAYGGGTVLGDPTDCGDPTGQSAGNPGLPPMTSGRITALLRWAQAQLGEPYVYGANGPSAWDCSSYTRGAYARVGITLPRTAQAQRDWLATGNGYRVPAGHERPGDLVFTNTYLGPNRIGHVMIVFDPATHTSIEAVGSKVQYDHYTRYTDQHIFEIWRVGNIADHPTQHPG